MINRDEMFKNKIFLGPMAGVTDLPFRLLCKEQGADVMVTEMVSAKGLYYGSRKTDLLLQTDDREKPVGVQLFGSDPDIMAGEAEKLAKRGFDFIDINMGCPVPKIVNNGEGSALMKNPELAESIVRSIVEAVDIPVTVKIRAGFTKDSINAPEIDITCGEDAVRMKKETGCDSVMVARAAKGNPWVFREIKGYLDGNVPERPDLNEIRDMILRHIDLMIDMKGEYIGVRELRKHVAWYTEGIYNSSMIRRKVCEIESKENLVALIKKLGDK